MSASEINVDVAVIGGGPGGYPAAIRLAQRGASVALIESKSLGGTCLHRGCIPTKALIASGAVAKSIQHAKEHGIEVDRFSIDYLKMWERKNRVVETMYSGLKNLIKSYPIRCIQGHATFVEKTLIKVMGEEPTFVRAKKVIIATGSEPRALARFPVDGVKVHDSTTLLAMQKLPTSLVIVGGGIIGAEFASLYGALGVKVTIVEMLESLLPLHSPKIQDVVTKAFRKEGMQIYVSTSVKAIEKEESGVRVALENGQELLADAALIAVGRKRNTDQIGVEKAGLLLEADGGIATNSKMETSVPGIYAIGDVTGSWWLAHVASHQGIIAADNAAGHAAEMDYRAIPAAVFTDPEVATVGLSLKEAKAAGYLVKEASYPFQALGKSQATGHPEGFATLIIDSRTGAILGGEVVGDNASTLIAEIGLAIYNELTVECLIETVHAHPTLPEVWLEAALIANGTPLHFPALKKVK